jgi:hypothetical protein
MDVTQLVRQAGTESYSPVARGYISKVLTVAEGVEVILPAGSTERHYGPCKVAALWGTTEPKVGAACVIVFDEQNQPTVVWWDGVYGGEEDSDILPISNTLPAGPVNGQLIYYQEKGTVGESEMEKLGIVWALRYRSASASAHKWEFVGGASLAKGPEGALELTAKEEKALTAGPSLTVPLTGDYEVRLGLYAQTPEAAAVEMLGFVRKGGVATGPALFRFISTGAFALVKASDAAVYSFTAADALTIGCKIESAQKVKFVEGRLSIQPVRVG